MDFESYCISKKIDPVLFKEDTPQYYHELAELFEQMHPNSFTSQKLFVINNIRRQYKLTRVVANPEPNKAATQPVVKPVIATEPTIEITTATTTSTDAPKKPVMKIVMKPKLPVSEDAQSTATNDNVPAERTVPTPKPVMKVVMKPRTLSTEAPAENTVQPVEEIKIITPETFTAAETTQASAAKKPMMKVVMKPKAIPTEPPVEKPVIPVEEPNPAPAPINDPATNRDDHSSTPATPVKKPMARPIMKKRE